MNEDPDLLAAAAAWLERGHAAALATVVRTWGSAPCRAGSHLVVRGDGEFLGSVSGGCVEAAVVRGAVEVLDGGGARTLSFGVVDEDAWAVGLACGGRIEVYVERIVPRQLEALRRGRAETHGAVRIVDLSAGAARVLATSELKDALPTPLVEAARSALRFDRVELREEAGARTFVQPLLPPPRLVIVGAVHIAQTLVQFAPQLGLRVTLVDPRAAWATDTRFPTLGPEQLVQTRPGDALAALRIDRRTAVVTLTHDPKIDDPALRFAVQSDAFYIGALGSEKTHGARLRRLRDDGIEPAALRRIAGPVGVPIGARTPAEIALSILAEVVQAHRVGFTPRMRTRAVAPRIGAVVLAAGRSRRMGSDNKLLVEVDGRPMVRTVAEAALSAGADPIVVVTGHEAPAVRTALSGLPVEHVHNPGFAEGISTSLGMGIASLEGRVDAAFVMLGDMPYVRAAHLDALHAAFEPEASRSICVPTRDGRQGNPVLFAAALFAEMQALRGDRGAKGLLVAHRDLVVEVPIDDAGVLLDLDTPEAVAAARDGSAIPA